MLLCLSIRKVYYRVEEKEEEKEEAEAEAEESDEGENDSDAVVATNDTLVADVVEGARVDPSKASIKLESEE